MFSPGILYAICAAVTFSAASLLLRHYAGRVSVLWMNAFKATIAFAAFGVAAFATGAAGRLPSLQVFLIFFSSGLIALNIGDMFMLRGFTTIGPARTLMIYSFQPVVLGATGFLLFGQPFGWTKALAIVTMMACLFTLSYEGYRRSGKWDLKAVYLAVTGMLLDAAGVTITRYGFESDTAVTVFDGNFYRTCGAITGFVVMSRFAPIHLVSRFKALPRRDRSLALAGGFLGTFVALWFWIAAVRYGHLASVGAVGGTAPVFATFYEAVIQRSWPSRYAFAALALCAAGFWLLNR